MDAPELDLDLYSDEAIADPYPIYRRIRDLGPAVRLVAHDAWAIGRFEDVRAALRADTVLVSGRADGEWTTGRHVPRVLGLDEVAAPGLAATDLRDRLAADAVTVIDLDLSRRHAQGHIPGAWFAIRARLRDGLAKLPPGQPIVLTSSDGALARLPVKAARRVHVVSPVDVSVECDEARMRRALYSILDNALKYSSSSSQVELAVRAGEGMVHLEIRDHGVGIPAAKQANVFDKFFRAHAGTPHDAGGIGVGLFVARAIIVQHGGRIWFESVEHRGTTFFVELPLEGETR